MSHSSESHGTYDMNFPETTSTDRKPEPVEAWAVMHVFSKRIFHVTMQKYQLDRDFPENDYCIVPVTITVRDE